MVVFGAGYLGRAVAGRIMAHGGRVAATSRDPERRDALEAEGITAIDPADEGALSVAVVSANALLITAPPEATGCPAARSILAAIRATGSRPDWIGYVSSTAVYGDRNGGWAFESDALNAASLEGARRVRAERMWLEAGVDMDLCVHLFRLPAIYGPGRSVIDRLTDGSARLVRKPGQIFNRVHVEDVVDGLVASMARPRAGGIYNLTDDEPAPADVVMEWAADRLALPRPPEVEWTDASVSAAMRRFYLDSKRISNARAKAELGWKPRYPSWREGLESLLG